MINLNPEMFRAYDIRGIVDRDLSPEIMEVIGKAFGTFLLNKGTKDVVVGRDSRATSEEYQKSLTRGILSTGCNVFDVGLTLSSGVYFARQHFKIDGAAYVTASHNPPQYNGLKLCSGLKSISDKEIQIVKDIAISGEFKSGQGEEKKLDSNSIYFEEIRKRVNHKKKLKIVIDAGNATAGPFLPDFLRSMGFDVVPLHCDLDPTYPNHTPDPVHQEAYKDLIAKIKEEKADVGLLFDGDGDRLGFVDEKGNIHLGDIILGLLIRDIIPRNPGRKVIVELKDSEMVVDETKRLGGIPIIWKTGHSFLDPKVHEENAILCAEMSCHYWIVDNWFIFDDAVHTAARVLQIISNSDKTLSELVDDLPKYVRTPEYRVACPEEKKFKFVEEVVEYFKTKCDRYIDVDGIRGYLEDGWFLLRASNTQPLLAIRCEAKTQEGLDKIKSMVKEKLDQYDFVNLDWNRQYDKE
ncbi:MAG: phosphomannomutase/phosphoglucomutase [Candidatus Aenigmatarchaeota archaeon]